MEETFAASVSLIFGILGLGVYFAPTLIAGLRRHPNLAPVLVVNLLLGWICIGWVIALAWALSAIDRPTPPPATPFRS